MEKTSSYKAPVTTSAPAAVKAEVETDPRKQKYKVIVNRLNVAEGNQDLVIVVNDLGVVNGRISFYPGQEVELTQVQIDILKEAVEVNHIDIPPGSGVYSSVDPVAAVQAAHPGFVVKRNHRTGGLFAEKVRPNYSINIVG